MLLVQSYGAAVILLFITMLCWGSWSNTQKLASQKWPFQLFYWDYAIGVVLFSFLLGITAGSTGDDGRSFFSDLGQGSFDALSSAFIGGVVFNIANLLLVASIDIAGMALAFPVGIGLALVIGVVVNYLANPIGDPVLLSIGVILIVIAILLDSFVYRKMTTTSSASAKGLGLAIVAGILMGFFFRFVAAATSLNFENPETGLLTPYSSVFIFSLGLFISNFIWNTLFMRFPFTGSKVSYSQYIKEGNLKLHMVGILGGIIWCIGMSFSMLSSSQAGFAISYGLGQGATMVAAIWGVFIWKEFAGAPKNLMRLVYLMFLFFSFGIIIIILSKT